VTGGRHLFTVSLGVTNSLLLCLLPRVSNGRRWLFIILSSSSDQEDSRMIFLLTLVLSEFNCAGGNQNIEELGMTSGPSTTSKLSCNCRQIIKQLPQKWGLYAMAMSFYLSIILFVRLLLETRICRALA